MPFTLDLRSPWVFSAGPDIEGTLSELSGSDPAAAEAMRRLLTDTSPTADQFFAVRTDDPGVTLFGSSTDTGGYPTAAVLVQLEKQNVDGLTAIPGMIGKPVSDRFTLPVGETVRVRFQAHDVYGPASGDVAWIGYAFVAGSTAYTFVFSAPMARIGALEPEFERILGTFDARPGPTPTTTSGECASIGVTVHDAPDLEAALPPRVAGRALATWSLEGRCWLEMAGVQASQVDEFVAQMEAQGAGTPIDLGNLGYAVAGRADTKLDPPYFVFGANRPLNQSEIDLTNYLLFKGAGFADVTQGTNLHNYEPETIAGRQVWVGSAEMLNQSSHQRGRPYLYQTDRYMFVIVTDEPSWAADAIAQLPD